MRKQLRDMGRSSFTDDQLWHWHGYDYGWRRAYLNNRDERSPIDESGEWFNVHLADSAEKMFNIKIGKGTDDRPR